MDLLTLAIVAFGIAVITGAMGYTGVRRATATTVRILFGVSMIIALILLVLALLSNSALIL